MSRKHNRDKKKHKQETSDDHSTGYVAKEIASYALIIIVAVLLSSHLSVVVSGSMEPTFYRGDIVATENVHTYYGVQEFNPKTDIQVGDVVVYTAEWYPEPVIHRVIGIEDINGSEYYLIKGDNNEVADPYYVRPDQIRAKVITVNNNLLIIPKLGYITIWFRGL